MAFEPVTSLAHLPKMCSWLASLSITAGRLQDSALLQLAPLAPTLRSLQLKENNLVSIKALAALTGLQVLHLDCNSLTSLQGARPIPLVFWPPLGTLAHAELIRSILPD